MKKVRKTTATVHVNVVGRALKEQVGLSRLTRMYNSFRAGQGLAAVKEATVSRYLGAGKGYEVSAPRSFAEFCISRVAMKK